MHPLPVASTQGLCCPPLGEQPRLTDTEAIVLSSRLKSLAEPARVSIVSILAGLGDHALTTRDLAPQVGLSEATVSHHLKQLAEAGLVHKRREGARVLYHLDVPAVRGLAAVLTVCCDCCGDPGS
jgi:ArsR family transcriptional regulator